MPSMSWIKTLSLRNKGLYYKLSIAFGSFFLFPIFGFLYFSLKYGMLTDQNIPIFFLIVLAFSLLGFFLLRSIVDEVSKISRSFSAVLKEAAVGDQPAHVGSADELRAIVSSFETLNSLFRRNVETLNQEATKLSTLKEVSNLCYITFDMDELFFITLERALTMVQAKAGSVLILERPQKNTFVVQATIGREGKIKKGDRIDVASSLAKYAVINKSPLLVVDIEQDKRFGEKTRSSYETKSFICMPLKTINDIVGVLTVTSKIDASAFTQEDVDALTPLLSNASLSYNNLSLLKKNERLEKLRKSFDRISRSFNSTLKGDELLHTVLREIEENVPFSMALSLIVDETVPNDLLLFDIVTSVPASISVGMHFPYADSIIDSAMRQEQRLIVSDTQRLSHELDKKLFIDQGIQSIMLNPLKLGGKIVGVLALGSIDGHAYTFREGELIHCLIEQYSAAIEKDRLNVSVVKRTREMETLKQVGNFLAASTFDIDRVLKYTMDMVGMLMRIEAGSLLLLEDQGLVFKVVLNNDLNVLLKKFTLKMGQGIVGYAAARGEPIIVRDVSISPHFYPEIDEATGFKTRSSLCVPMISQGKVIGAIEVLNKIGGEFDDNDVQLLQSIAASVSIALENAGLYKQTLSMAKQERDIRKMFQKFVPKDVIEKIISEEEGERMWVGELKTLTFLNIDIRGFSLFSKSIGPQKTVSMLNYFFSTMGNLIFKYEGIVDKYLGDGFLALFGTAKTSVTDADNALSAALDMKEAMEAVNRYLQHEIGQSLSIGISINTGETVIGNIGFEQKMDYTVIGDAVNTVFRIQDICRKTPNTILASEKTLQAVQSPPEVREVGAFDIDSSTERLRIYEIIGRKNTAS